MPRERNERMRRGLEELARRRDRSEAALLLEGIPLGVSNEQLAEAPPSEAKLIDRLHQYLSDTPADALTIDFGEYHAQAISRVSALAASYLNVGGYLIWSRIECSHAFEVDLAEALSHLGDLWLLTNKNVYLLETNTTKWLALELDYYDTENEYVADGAVVLRTNFDRGVV